MTALFRSFEPRSPATGTGQLHPGALHPGALHADELHVGELQRLRDDLARAQLALETTRAELVLARHAAQRDTLTGLPNRRGFESPSRRALAAHDSGALTLALLFVDLDGFKAVNDRLGHDVGDALLRIVGARLTRAVREGDLVCRHGGDEFLCLLPHLANPERAEAIAEDLVRAIAAPCQIGPHCVQVTASVGLAMYPRDGASIEALLRSADAAMYAAKALGNRVAGTHRLWASAPSSPQPSLTV